MLCSDVSDLIVLKLKCHEYLYIEKKLETTDIERETGVESVGKKSTGVELAG